MTLAVYTYFIACLFGRQYLLPTQYKVEGNSYLPAGNFLVTSSWTETKIAGTTNIIGYDENMADCYVPVFTILQYLFYMGWLKVFIVGVCHVTKLLLRLLKHFLILSVKMMTTLTHIT